MPRLLVHFSCGAASAVAAKLTLAENSKADIAIVNAFLEEEHEDNHRFRSECERWFDHPITVLTSEKDNGSTIAVWTRKRYIKGPGSAPCAVELKHKPLAAFSRSDDLHILGYTAEEVDRLDALRISAPKMQIRAPLIDKNLTKADCLAMIERAGIALPVMYLLGFNNNNCIGCPKGGLGYWNRIKAVFPERFYQIAALQESIGPGAYFLRNNQTGDRLALKDLPADAGNHREPDISCSFFCQMAEEDIAIGGAC